MTTIFSYKKKQSIIHNASTLLKLIIYFMLSILVFLTNLHALLYFYIAGIIIMIASKIEIKYVLIDIKQALVYVTFIMLSDSISYILRYNCINRSLLEYLNYLFCLKIIIMIFYTSIFFRTTNFYNLFSLFFDIEMKLAKKRRIADLFTLYITFIPKLFKIYSDVELAYRSRNGKNGIRKFIMIFPIFLRNSFLYADRMYLLIKSRK